jgi:hypothetical protein
MTRNLPLVSYRPTADARVRQDPAINRRPCDCSPRDRNEPAGAASIRASEGCRVLPDGGRRRIMLCTPLCRTLGISSDPFRRYRICRWPGVGGRSLERRWTRVLGTASLPARFVRLQINRLRELSDRPFGVNVVLPLLRRGTMRLAWTSTLPSSSFSGVKREKLDRSSRTHIAKTQESLCRWILATKRWLRWRREQMESSLRGGKQAATFGHDRSVCAGADHC